MAGFRAGDLLGRGGALARTRILTVGLLERLWVGGQH